MAIKSTNLSVVTAVQLPRHERVALLVDAVGGQKRASEIAGVSPDTINNWRKEGAKLPIDGLLQLCTVAGVSLDWVATGHMLRPDLLDSLSGPGLAEAGLLEDLSGTEFRRLRPLRADLAVGSGHQVQRFVPSEIAVNEQWLKREFNLPLADARYALVEDDGMAPRIGRGAMVVLDARVAAPRSGLVLIEGDELLARRLYRMPDGVYELTADGDANWRFRTDDPAALPPLHRIVWAGQKL